MNLRHWLLMYATSFAVAFLVIALAQSAKGHDGRYALTQGLLWGAISAAIFVAATSTPKIPADAPTRGTQGEPIRQPVNSST